ncbi:MAG: helix-turn-helix domain-containing protein [Planctomycetaceae bacterium]
MPPSSRGKPTSTARGLTRRLDGLDCEVWIVDASNRLVWLNEACGKWLGCDPAQLLGRVAIASATSDDPLDQVAASLAPPLGLDRVGLVCASCEPAKGVAQLVRYLRVGDADSALVIASTGQEIALQQAPDVDEINRVRARLHQWRKRDATWGGIAAAGSSQAARRLRAQIQLAAGTLQDISIVGPAGCGGELIARRIHAHSAPVAGAAAQGQTAAPLVVIDGPLMDAELLEASLSPAAAHLGGSSSDSSTRSCTLLVRGLDETPLDVQQQIEQFIAEHVGSIRLIGLLGMQIDEAVQAKRLNPALAARLDVLCLRVAALSARVQDIPLMASAIVDARRAGGSGSAERLSRAALDRLVLYPWPSNFDELDAALRSAMTACPGPAIGPEHLPLAIRSYRPGEPIRDKEPLEKDLDRALEQFELRLIRAALQASAGNRSEAARSLGISRARLLRRIGEAEQDDS